MDSNFKKRLSFNVYSAPSIKLMLSMVKGKLLLSRAFGRVVVRAGDKGKKFEA